MRLPAGKVDPTPFSLFPNRMPKRVLIIGLLFFIVGLLSIWEVLGSFLTRRIHLDLEVFCLPIGFGLLSGKPSARNIASIWIILSYIFCILAVILIIFLPHHAVLHFFSINLEGEMATLCDVGLMAFIAAIHFQIHRLLYSAKAETFFRPQ
jgi:hypothetical protein